MPAAGAATTRAAAATTRQAVILRMRTEHTPGRRMRVAIVPSVRWLVAIPSLALILLMLGEFFLSFLSPQRVRREARVARWLIVRSWRGWPGGGAPLRRRRPGDLARFLRPAWAPDPARRLDLRPDPRVYRPALRVQLRAGLGRHGLRGLPLLFGGQLLLGGDQPQCDRGRRPRDRDRRGDLRLPGGVWSHRLPAGPLPGLFQAGGRRVAARPPRGESTERRDASVPLGQARWLGRAGRLPGRLGELGRGADGNPSLLSVAGLLSLAARQPELALGPRHGPGHLGVRDRHRARAYAGRRGDLRHRPPRAGRSCPYLPGASARARPRAPERRGLRAAALEAGRSRRRGRGPRLARQAGRAHGYIRAVRRGAVPGTRAATTGVGARGAHRELADHRLAKPRRANPALKPIGAARPSPGYARATWPSARDSSSPRSLWCSLAWSSRGLRRLGRSRSTPT